MNFVREDRDRDESAAQINLLLLLLLWWSEETVPATRPLTHLLLSHALPMQPTTTLFYTIARLSLSTLSLSLAYFSSASSRVPTLLHNHGRRGGGG